MIRADRSREFFIEPVLGLDPSEHDGKHAHVIYRRSIGELEKNVTEPACGVTGTYVSFYFVICPILFTHLLIFHHSSFPPSLRALILPFMIPSFHFVFILCPFFPCFVFFSELTKYISKVCRKIDLPQTFLLLVMGGRGEGGLVKVVF